MHMGRAVGVSSVLVVIRVTRTEYTVVARPEGWWQKAQLLWHCLHVKELMG